MGKKLKAKSLTFDFFCKRVKRVMCVKSGVSAWGDSPGENGDGGIGGRLGGMGILAQGTRRAQRRTRSLRAEGGVGKEDGDRA